MADLINAGKIYQIGILVPGLEPALRLYSAAFGLGPWARTVYGPKIVTDFTYRGKPAQYEMEIALTGDSPQIELIETKGQGGFYGEWIDQHGYGLHHLGFRVPSIAEAVRAMTAAGYEVLQSGRGYGLDGDGGFACFSTIRDFGIILEAIEIPRRRRPPDAVWPSITEVNLNIGTSSNP